MGKIIRVGLAAMLLSLTFFFNSGEKAQAATATCLDLHAGFCVAAGLHYGVNTNIDFSAVKALLEKHYKDHSDVLAWSYMEYKGGHWYWVCVNMDVIRFDGVAAPCNPSAWRAYGTCSEACDGGVQYRYNDCGTRSPARACNPQPCCGSADRETYKTTPEVEAAQRCNAGDTMSNWVNNSGLASNGGIAWTWNCNDGTADSSQCLAYKEGKCATVAGSYPDREAACEDGLFNSVQLTPGGILKWKCGTGGQNKSLGSFTSNEPNLGPATINDNFGPRSIGSGGVECQCAPNYKFTCIDAGDPVGSCANNCDGYITQPRVAVKIDTDCFPSESLPTNKSCASRQVRCAPCGTQDSEGGSYHETAY
jgi:hypothetical protein